MKNTEPSDDKVTTIRVTEKTKRLLAEKGGFSDTYETVILRLLEESKKRKSEK